MQMQKKYLIFIFIICLFCFGSDIFAEKLDTLLSTSLNDYLESVPDEKYIINTDREIYFINESIWFNVWSIDDITHIPVTRSRLIYLELIGDKGSTIVQQSLVIKKNLACGRILIPAAVSSGIYYLRAYTNWQKNFGTKVFGIKIIQIINPYDAPINIHPGSSEIAVSYFPEGGRLVYGIRNKVIVEAKYDNGNFASLKNTSVTDQTGTVITSVKELSKGIGVFYLDPEQGISYFINPSSGARIPLQIYDEGLVIGLTIEPEFIRATVNGRSGKPGESFYFVARNSGIIFFEKEFKFNNRPEVFSVQLNKIPQGLTDFSILKSNYELVSQRLFFKRYENKDLAVDIVPEKQVFSTRDKVILKIAAPDYKDISFLSMTIRKKGLVLPSLLPDLQADIFLHSNTNDWDEFKLLEINNPDIPINDIINDFLITKALARNPWDEVLSGNHTGFLFAPEIKTKIISGFAVNPVTNEPIKNNKLLMYYIHQVPYLLMSNTDEQGKFYFYEPIKNYGEKEVLIQAEKPVIGLSVKFDLPYFEECYPYRLNDFYYDSLSPADINNAFVTWQINMIHREKNESLNKKIPGEVQLSFYGPPDGRFNLKEFVYLDDMTEVFREIVENVRIREKDGVYTVNIFGKRDYESIGDHPLLLYNGHVIDNIAPVLNIPVQKMDFVDVITRKFFIGKNKFDGILSVFPQDVATEIEAPQNSCRYILDLFSEETIFGTRDYSLDQDDPLPDLRNTLYWNPDIRLEGAETTISFYSGDDTGKFELELKGIRTDGQIIQINRYIEIQ